MKYVECIQDMVSWFTTVWEVIWCNGGPASGKERLWLHWAREVIVGKSECLSVIVCGIWTFLRDHMIYSKSQILRYKEKNNDILKACFGFQGPQNHCNACVAKIGLYLRNQSCLCHDPKWDMCVGVISTHHKLFHVITVSCCRDIHWSLTTVKTLQWFCRSL